MLRAFDRGISVAAQVRDRLPDVRARDVRGSLAGCSAWGSVPSSTRFDTICRGVPARAGKRHGFDSDDLCRAL